MQANKSTLVHLTPDPYSWWIDSLFLLLVLGSLFFLLLGQRPLFTPDEGRYAEIAREMVALGDYITPYLNGVKYFEKPILFYWLEAIAIKSFGLNLWSLRGINALLGLVGCLLTYITTRHLYDRRTALLAALILGTSTLYFVMVHMISLDLPVTFFITISLYAFLLGVQNQNSPNRWLIWIAAASAGFAVLSKGLIGIVFPLLIVAVWLSLVKKWNLLKSLFIPSSFIIFCLIVIPWHLIVGARNPEFFHFYFIEQHLLRYTDKEIGHYQPVWFFLPNLILGFFPWIVFLPQTLTRVFKHFFKKSKTYQTELFLFLWVLLIFLFFSFSKSKLIPYILPIFPPLAILTANYLSHSLQKQSLLGLKIGYFFLLLFSVLINIVFIWFIQTTTLPHPTIANIYLKGAAILLVTGSIISCILVYTNAQKAIITTFMSIWFFFILLLAAIPSVDTRTILPLVQKLKPILQPQDEVITYNQYYQDLPFYLERRVSILNWRNELTFGMRYQHTQEWMIQDEAFWQRFHSKQRVFALMSKDEYKHLIKNKPDEKIYFIASTANNVLISNRP